MTIRGGGLKHVACAEDEDFIQALDKMMLENLQVRPVPRPPTGPHAWSRVTLKMWARRFAPRSSGAARP